MDLILMGKGMVNDVYTSVVKNINGESYNVYISPFVHVQIR